MSIYEEQFNNLSDDEKDSILDFLFSITEGDIMILGGEMQMDRSDIRKLCKAVEAFQAS